MARFTHIQGNLIKNLDIISVAQKGDLWRWVTKPISMAISCMISNQLSKVKKTPISVSHSAIYLDGYIYEIHVNALNKIKADDYFDDNHDYAISELREFDTYSSKSFLDACQKADEFLSHVFVHQKNRTKYDSKLIFKIFNHLRKGTLENIKTSLTDLDFICSELVQLTLKEACGHSILNRVALPSDFFDNRYFRVYRFKKEKK